MAFEDDIRSFMENRLQAFDPTIDLSANSTAQQQIIDPLIERLGEDPFSVDISSFLRDRLIQEFPDLAADGAGLLEDIFTKPMQLVLEPFKRQIESSRLNMSVENASLMSDEEADALGANFFQDREEGDYAGGPVRIYFAAPTTVRITTDRQVSSRSGLAYFPTDNTFITSQSMLFNREGDQFFVDIVVRAEEPGSNYNIDENEIISIDDVDGVVRVTNPSAFNTGLPRQTNEEYLGAIPQSLTERSLVTKRGITTRVPDAFGSSVRAVQVIGAGEDGMDRDILKGTGEGFLHIVAGCSFFGSWVFVSSILYKDDGPDNDITVQPGDKIRLILSFASDSNRTAYEAVVSEIISDDVGLATEKYILILDRTLDTVVGTIGSGAVVSIFKPGFITISELPGGISSDITVAGDTVHLGGHSDVLIRPSADERREGVLPNLTDGDVLLPLLDLATTLDDNIAASATNFVTAGVQAGDVLVIESGASAGSYRILSVGSPDAATALRVDAVFTVAESGLRARIIRTITVDLVEPKVPKIPFQPGPVSDLQTAVGSTLFRLSTINVQSFGVEIGDTIRVLDGLNAGDYVITGFDTILGGQGPIVDRPAAATAANQRYEVFTAATGLEFPLVRIRSLELLDSTNQGTGITIPYGDAVDVRPVCALEGAGKKVRVLEKLLISFPDASTLWGSDGTSLAQTFATAASATSDARYSKGIEVADGRVRMATSSGPPNVPIDETEINLPPFLYNGRRDTLLALTTREDTNFTVNLPNGGQHRTSDIAEARIGDSLVILDGPNKGNYTIQDLRVLEMWSQGESGHHRIALVQLDQELKIDPLKTVIDFINAANIVADVSATDLAGGIEDSTIFFTSDFWTTVIVDKLHDTLVGQGFSITSQQVERMLLDLCAYGYEIGPSARGTIRVLFQEPVSAEFFFDEQPTFFKAVVNESLRYRLDPDIDPSQLFPEATKATPPTEWNRDLAISLSDTTRAFLVSGSSFVQRGVRDGDVLEFHKAINDLPARKNMTSSWLFVTVAGQNTVTAIFPGGPNNPRPDNETNVEPGHLFFIDSGPDMGAYVVTEVVSTDFSANPPSIQFKIDRTLTHSTDTYPVAANRDFGSAIPAVLATSGNTFPMALTGLELSIDLSSDALGSPVNYDHVFGVGPFNTITDVVNSLNGDSSFTGPGDLIAVASGNELVIRSLLSEAPRERLTENGSTAIGVSLLRFTPSQTNGGFHGGVGVAGTKRVFGTGLTGFVPNQWVSIYAAQNPTIITSGEDISLVGTYRIVAAGTQVGGPRNGYTYFELDRSTNFAEDVELRWVRHSEPEVTPSDTSGGGKELATRYVRGRLYDEVPSRAVITIPWAASPNPILATSENQIDLSVSPVAGGENFTHRMPYRIIREGSFRISSTEMEANRQGALYYVDLPVIGIGTLEDLNIDESIGLLLDGRYNVAGYTLRVDNEIFSYSTREQVSIVLPSAVLPVGATPDLDNEIKLAGQNLQVNYDSAPLIASIQQFFDSPLDRVVCANVLVRHFLPSYVFLDVNYVGGDDEDTVAGDLIKYINDINPDLNELSSDEISKIIRQHGAVKVKQPINLVVLTHGTDRRIRGTQSEDVIGGTNLPTFQGNFKQTYFISGPNTSGEDPRPNGEQVFLVRT
jgi:hypothetical protein